MSKPTQRTEWDARPVDDNLVALKRDVDRGYKWFWSKPGRVEPKEPGFRELMQAEARSGKRRKKEIE